MEQPTNFKFPNSFFEGMFRRPAEGPLPNWMSEIIREECEDLNIPIPAVQETKVIEAPDAMFGYTTLRDDGIRQGPQLGITIVWGIGGAARAEERLTLIHELAHWTHGVAGHGIGFYAEEIRLALKYGVDLDKLQESEYNYQGDTVYRGIEYFHNLYNVGWENNPAAWALPGFS